MIQNSRSSCPCKSEEVVGPSRVLYERGLIKCINRETKSYDDG